MPWTNRGWEEPDATRGAFYPWRGTYPDWPRFHRQERHDAGPPPVGRTSPLHRPHYTDERFAQGREHTLYGAAQEGLSYEYSDRLWQWDYEKARLSSAWADRSEPVHGSPDWWEVWLTNYHGKPVSLRHIIGGVNVSSGYEYYIFGFKDADR